MKIAIAGAGAMGSRFGVRLHEAGHQVILIDKWQAHLDAINEKGLEVDDDGEKKFVKMPAYLPSQVTEVQDLVIVLTKSMGLPSMLEAIQPILDENTKVLCLLNGLGHEKTVAQYVPAQNVLMGVTMWTAGLVGPGHISLSGGGSVEIQNIEPEMTEFTKNLCDSFTKAGLNAKYSQDVLFSIWRKACVNGTLNSLCTMIDCNIQEFGQLTAAPVMIRQIISEFALIAEKDGVHLDVETVAKGVEAAYAPDQAGAHYPSMHQDLIQHHRKTEIDYLNGYISKKAKEAGFKTPYCDLITELIHSKEEILVK